MYNNVAIAHILCQQLVYLRCQDHSCPRFRLSACPSASSSCSATRAQPENPPVSNAAVRRRSASGHDHWAFGSTEMSGDSATASGEFQSVAVWSSSSGTRCRRDENTGIFVRTMYRMRSANSWVWRDAFERGMDEQRTGLTSFTPIYVFTPNTVAAAPAVTMSVAYPNALAL